MHSTPAFLTSAYDANLVALSVLIACMASYAALDLGGRVTFAQGWARRVWLVGGAAAMGTGIWSMHYIGMLAFHLPVPVLYDWPTVLVSWLAAVGASGIALFVVSRERLGAGRAILGSVFMGAGIAAMHYIGMAAMRVPAMHHYSIALVTLSVVLAIVISLVALWLTFHLRGDLLPWGWKKIGSSVIMGAAIPVMHYTGMAAASFSPAPLAESALLHAVSVSSLGMTGIVAATLTVLALALVTATVDRHLSAQVSGRRQAESALVDSQRAYEITFDAAPIGIAHMTLDGRWLRANPQLCAILDVPLEAFMATNLRTLTHPDEQAQGEQVRLKLAGGALDRHVFLTRLRQGTGGYLWANVTMSVNRDAAGTRTHIVTIVEDITERRNLEEQIRQTQKMEAIGRLASGISHDFNNILAVIVGFTEHAVSLLKPDDPMRSDLDQVLQAGRSGALLTQQLLTFSRKQVVRLESLDLNAVVSQMNALLEHAVGAKVRFDVRLGQDLHRIHADRGQIEQVMMNLAVNARDAMPSGGVLTIETANVNLDENDAGPLHDVTPGPHVKLSVSDTGVGIPDEVRAHLFEPFFTTKERGKGTGLGLAIVYGILKQSGGSVQVESTVGRGTTFNVFLPRHEIH